jgi:hypothetical protein
MRKKTPNEEAEERAAVDAAWRRYVQQTKAAHDECYARCKEAEAAFHAAARLARR